MKRHSESVFTSLALALLLALTLFYGCRAFDPEPVIVNRLPETFIIGAPPETTGSRFLRHLYWYGADEDGDVVQFIYAITDSTIQDLETDEDEEDARFNPALDVTTLTNESWRVVGYTAKTDSVFLFTVDRGETPSKEVTFHLVAVDDRGAIDPTPARLRFINNSLGNPALKFAVYTEEREGGQDIWVRRWVGTTGQFGGPTSGESPELTREPFVGFGRKFRVEWEGSSPNGPILGYRMKANQNSNASYEPPLDFDGSKRWDPALTSFLFANSAAPTTLPDCRLNPNTGELSDDSFCDPAMVRWPSDRYTLLVEALDLALVESEQSLGELHFNVNYPPETEVVRDSNYPLVTWLTGGGPQQLTISEGDTIPHGSYLVVDADGYDHTQATVAPAEYGTFCCDTPRRRTEVQFQAKYIGTKDDKNTTTETQSLFSYLYPDTTVVGTEPDTIGVNVGPMSYAFLVRAVDEHRRPDASPDTLRFVGGFRPRLLSTSPAAGDSLLLRFPPAGSWANSLPYQSDPISTTRWWSGVDFVDEDPCAGLSGQQLIDCQAEKPAVSGNYFSFAMTFEGQPHPNEELLTAVRAWSFSQQTENDPLNVLIDGLESEDLSFFNCSPTPNLWTFSPAQSLEYFVPQNVWFFPERFEPAAADATVDVEIGKWLVRRLGEATLRVQGRTTCIDDKWPVYPHVRPDAADPPTRTPIGKSGRRTYEHTVRWSIYLGLGNFGDTLPTRIWPDFKITDYD